MAANLTSGYDILIQLSEDEINEQLQTLFLAGELEIPSTMSFPFNFPGFVGTANINLGMPEVFLDEPNPRIRIDFPVEDSEVVVGGIPVGGLNGLISVVHPVTVRNLANSQQIVLDFTTSAPAVTFEFDATTAALINPFLPTGTTLNDVTESVETQVATVLTDEIIRLSITPAIPTSNTDPLVPSNISVRTINDNSAADRDALVFGVDMITGSPGNINGITTNFIPNGEDSILMLSNDWLLGDIIRPELATALGIPLSSLSRPCTLNTPVPAPGGQGTLISLMANVVGNRIRVNGVATDNGTGWSAIATFSFFVELSLVDGAIVVTATEPDIDTDVDLEWWVWLASLGLGAIFGGITGILVAAVVTAIVRAIVEGIAGNMISNGITSSLDELPPFPLGPIGTGINLENIILDDLELHGTITKSYRISTFHNGAAESSAAFSIDLETGQKFGFNQASSKIDLKYSPATGIQFVNGAKYRKTNRSYGALTALFVSKMALTRTNIAVGDIPSVLKIPFFSSGNEMVMGVRTNKGRLAKMKIYRDLLDGNVFKMDWITYDTPIPSISLNTKWLTNELGNRLDPRLVKGECCPAYEAAKSVMIEAVAKRLAYPVDLRWCIDGVILEKGAGTVLTKSGELQYEVEGRFLTLKAAMGQVLDSEVCLSAIDAKKIEVFKCIAIKSDGVSTTCPSKRVKLPLPIYEFLPVQSVFKRPFKFTDANFKRVIDEKFSIME